MRSHLKVSCRLIFLPVSLASALSVCLPGTALEGSRALAHMCIIGTLLSSQIHISAGFLGRKEQWGPDKSVAPRSVITTAQGRSIKPIISNLLMGSKQFPHIPRTARTARSHLVAGKENGIFGISYTCTTSPSLSTPCVNISVRYVKTVLKEGLFFFCSLINARKADLCQPGFFILSIQF